MLEPLHRKPMPQRRDCSDSPISNMLSVSIPFQVKLGRQNSQLRWKTFFFTLLQNTFLIGLDFKIKKKKSQLQAQTVWPRLGQAEEQEERRKEKAPPGDHGSRVWTSLCKKKRYPKQGDMFYFVSGRFHHGESIRRSANLRDQGQSWMELGKAGLVVWGQCIKTQRLCLNQEWTWKTGLTEVTRSSSNLISPSFWENSSTTFPSIPCS